MNKIQERQNVKPGGNGARGGAIALAEEGSGTGELSKADVRAKGNGRSRRNGLDARKERALVLVGEGRSVTEVAASLEIDRSTVHRWLRDPEFQRELSEHREEFLERTLDLQVYAATVAVHRLMELVESENENTALRAAQTLAGLAKTYMLMDQERRIRRLEDNLSFYFDR